MHILLNIYTMQAMKGNWVAVTEAETDLEKVITVLKDKEKEISDTEAEVYINKLYNKLRIVKTRY